jgi:G:T/U-mismatch repair DNA glycosylase
MDRYEKERHLYSPFVRPNTTHLIIGTFPTSAKRRFPFYYSGESNLFWKIMTKAYGHTFKYNDGEIGKTAREEFLEAKRFGMIDMIIECYRRNGSAQDKNLYPIILFDLFSLLDQYNAVDTLVFTSRSPAISALGLFNIYIHQRGHEMIDPQRQRSGLMVGIFKYRDRIYKVRVPYSPSQNSKKSKELGIDGLANMYREALE